MKFYVTIESFLKIKRSFLNLKLFSIINVDAIIEKYGYTYSTIDEYSSFIINNHIESLIKTYSRSKRTRGIIYINSKLNTNTIDNLRDIIEKYDKISEFVLLDEYNVPKLYEYYNLFNEIVFFPSIKKVRIIECKSIKDKINWKN